LVGYRLMAISSADSGVWNVSSVYAYYSTELLVPFLIFLRGFIVLRIRTKMHTNLKIFHLWFGFSAMHSFFAGIMAGVVTKTNVFHFLQWLYIPNHILMMIVFTLFPLVFIVGWFYNIQFLITNPIEQMSLPLKQQRIVLFYSMFLPLSTGVLSLFIPVSFSFHKYEFYEFFVLFMLGIPVLFYFNPKDFTKKSQNFSKYIHYKQLTIGLVVCLVFLVINWVRCFL
jgi:hypothetical protein